MANNAIISIYRLDLVQGQVGSRNDTHILPADVEWFTEQNGYTECRVLLLATILFGEWGRSWTLKSFFIFKPSFCVSTFDNLELFKWINSSRFRPIWLTSVTSLNCRLHRFTCLECVNCNEELVKNKPNFTILVVSFLELTFSNPVFNSQGQQLRISSSQRKALSRVLSRVCVIINEAQNASLDGFPHRKKRLLCFNMFKNTRHVTISAEFFCFCFSVLL